MIKKSIIVFILCFVIAFSAGMTPAGELHSPDYDFCELISLINAERARQGLGALVYDDSLLSYADIRARECSCVWSHIRPDGRPWSTVDEGSVHIYRGENLARGFVDGPDSDIYNAWLNSPVHYNTMMKPAFTRIAIAHYYNPETGYYTWAAGFGID